MLYCGDTHGLWAPIYRAAERCRPETVVLLGDYHLERPFEDVMRPVTEAGARIHWIAGNREGDSDAWYDNAFNSQLSDRDLNARVVEIGSHGETRRIAGLGGVFRYKIWHPDREPVWRSRADFLASLKPEERWRGGLPRRHRVSIWYEDYELLSRERADVLVSHEAPKTVPRRYGPLGWAVIEKLAEAMGVKTVFHGHHHTHYTARRPSGIVVHGVGLGAVVDENGATVEPPVRK
ncbi:MAG TPA: metallophosphoesterase [Alphaproteobacteria bacterium]|nr:metallophosphoesterase [Alphaproteobacteria bacterium]